MEWWLDLARVEEISKGSLLGRKVLDQLNGTYQVVEKGMVVATSFLLLLTTV